MKNNSTLFFIVSLSIMLTTGCAVNRTLSYKLIDTQTDFTVGTALIAFHDQREAVLSGKEKNTFCGHVNSTAQIAYNVQTQDGLPLSTEFAKALSTSMNEKGGKTSYLITEPEWTVDSIISLLAAKHSPRSLLFTIKEWEISGIPLFSTIRYEIRYSMTLSVLNENGIILASTTTEGSKLKEEGIAVSMKKMQAYSLETLQSVIHELLSNKDVTDKLVVSTDKQNLF